LYQNEIGHRNGDGDSPRDDSDDFTFIHSFPLISLTIVAQATSGIEWEGSTKFLDMYLFLEAGAFPTYFVAVYVVGFIAAVTIGSLAWYNSKRPPGWEESQRPEIVPDLKKEEKSEE
jgi:hypothetical protein